jgi:hypothetical protein
LLNLKWENKMIIVLTNSFKGNSNDKIAINTDTLVSIYETIKDDDEKVTNLFTVNNQTFSVEESMDEIVSMINGKKK